MATKHRHEDGGPGQESLIKCFEGGFEASGVANEHDGKIDDVVVTKAYSGQLYSLPTAKTQNQPRKTDTKGTPTRTKKTRTVKHIVLLFSRTKFSHYAQTCIKTH